MDTTFSILVGAMAQLFLLTMLLLISHAAPAEGGFAMFQVNASTGGFLRDGIGGFLLDGTGGKLRTR
jgi:hypothetical protein